MRMMLFGWAFLLLAACAPAPPSGVYYWKTTLDWTEADTLQLRQAGVDRVGLRLFDWGRRGEEGPLVVKRGLPAGLSVVPVVYVTTDRLETWAQDPGFDASSEALTLADRMRRTLDRAWPGTPLVWQLDADWTARTRDAWFAVVAAFRDLVHAQGGRLEVTVRLHQYRDRQSQGVPPADGGVLMTYGAGETVLDPRLVEGYLQGPGYPLPLAVAFPAYTQVRQFNGYGRLVALHRLEDGATFPWADLRAEGEGRWRVLRRATLGGRLLMARDVLQIDRVRPEDLAAVASFPAVRAMAAAGGVWWFDYASDRPLSGLP